jgi:hypothetical protein
MIGGRENTSDGVMSKPFFNVIPAAGLRQSVDQPEEDATQNEIARSKHEQVMNTTPSKQLKIFSNLYHPPWTQ